MYKCKDTHPYTRIHCKWTHSPVINTIITLWNLTLMNTEDKRAAVPPSLCSALHFLLTGPDSIFFESLRGSRKTTPAATRLTEIKRLLHDSLSPDILFTGRVASACQRCGTAQTTTDESHLLFIKRGTQSNKTWANQCSNDSSASY